MDRKYVQTAQVYRALGNPKRLAILNLLRDGEASREELLEQSKADNSVFAQHLARLRGSGLVLLRREGKRTYYRLSDPGVLKLCDAAEKIYKRSYK